MDYATIKLLHQTAVVLSGTGFAVRGIASLRGAQWTQGRAAKILGLLAYIGLGMVALRPRFAWKTRATAWVSALGVLLWIVSIAILKNPWGFLALVLPASA